MKIFIFLAVSVSILLADEIQRIESIVNDIKELRQKYENCLKEKDFNSDILHVEPIIQEKYSIKYLHVEPEKEQNVTTKNLHVQTLKQECKEKIRYIKVKDKSTCTQNREIKLLKDKIAKLEKEIQNNKKTYKTKDSFPHLKMQEAYKYLQD